MLRLYGGKFLNTFMMLKLPSDSDTQDSATQQSLRFITKQLDILLTNRSFSKVIVDYETPHVLYWTSVSGATGTHSPIIMFDGCYYAGEANIGETNDSEIVT